MLDIRLIFYYLFNMGKGKNKALNLSRADKTVLGLIANLNCPQHPFQSENEINEAIVIIKELQGVLNGKAKRVAACILDNKIQENDKIRNFADGLTNWAEKLYETS